ncbi:MAG: carboxymuconolactone decarboxylase family protein [Candidatus Adiutrix sp.]|jgi:AhpD family alkylhydroperoxidase|nr:carboxymuconolactone decarboxylase family protein [Candidatus Adiutrix sp.]
MLMDWKEFLNNTGNAFCTLGQANNELTQAVADLGTKGNKGALDAKTRELIALAVAATTRCDGCISIHAAEAVKAGASREELVEALSMSVALNAGAAAIYSSRILEAFDQHSK